MTDLDRWRDETLAFICARGFRYFSMDTAGNLRCWGLIFWP